MRRILKVDGNGVPNFIKAAKYATIASTFTPAGHADTYPYKRRAKRSEGAMYVLAYLAAALEDLEEEFGKPEPISGNVRKKIEKEFARLSAITGARTLDELLRMTSELLTILRAASKRSHIYPSRFLDAFGGYGTFARSAASLGIPVAYVELNPVAFFFFKTTVSGMPEETPKDAKDLLRFLEISCSEYYDGDVYATYRARLIKCPNCGAHVPYIRGSRYNEISRKKGKESATYKVELYRDDSNPFLYSVRRIVEGEGDRRLLCLECGRAIFGDKKKDERKPLYLEALRESGEIFAYGVPIADLIYKGGVRRPNVERIARALEDLEAELEELEKYLPIEPIPEESIDAEHHGLTELRSGNIYRTHAMTPRQLLCFGRLAKRIDENFSGPRKYRLAMLVTKALTYNVLTRTTGNERAKEIVANQSFFVPKTPIELSIPGPKTGGKVKGGGTFNSLLRNPERFSSVVYKIDRREIRLGTGFRVVGDRLPESGEVLALNEAAQKLDEYERLEEAFDFAFIDPPYLNMIPYRDLSRFSYVRLRRLLGEPLPGTRYKLEEIKEYDLTSDDINEFARKLGRVFEAISYVLRPDGFAVLQFAPPSYTDLLEFRSSVAAAAIEADLYPAMAATVLAEKSKNKIGPGGTISRTLFILLLKPDAFEDYLEELGLGGLDRIYIKANDEVVKGSKTGALEYIKNYVRAGRLDPLIDNIVKNLGLRLEEAIAIGTTLAAALTAKFVLTDFEETKEFVREIGKIVAKRIASKVAGEILENPKVSEYVFKGDLSRIYLLGLAYYELDLQLLSIIYERAQEAAKRSHYRLFVKGNIRKSRTHAAYIPVALKRLTGVYDKLSNAPLLSYVLEKFREYENVDRGVTKLKPRGEEIRTFLKSFLIALEKYSRNPAIKDDKQEKEVVEKLLTFLGERLARGRRGPPRFLFSRSASSNRGAS